MIDRAKLEAMPEAELRALAAKQGIPGADREPRAKLIDQLSESRARRLVDRAKEAVVEAAHKVEELIHPHAEPPAPKATAPSSAEGRPRPPRMPARAGFDVPSSTVHPHADELETLTMARRYLEEGQIQRAVEILEKLALHDPTDEALRGELGAARKKLPAPAAPPPAPPQPWEPLSMLDLEELPEIYGVDECEVLYKDPWWVFAYWEVTDGGLEAARAQLGPSAGSARMVLRLFTTVQDGAEVQRQVNDIDLHGRHGRRYLPSVKPGVHLRVAVGLLSPEGYFAPIAHSSLQRIPYAEPAPPGPVEWMEVIPARGRVKDPIVIVRRGPGEHVERGPLGEAEGEGEYEHLGTTPPGPGSSVGAPFGRRKPPGSSGTGRK